jgi:hypothetical protein
MQKFVLVVACGRLGRGRKPCGIGKPIGVEKLSSKQPYKSTSAAVGIVA